VANLNLFVAVGRAEKSELRSARRSVAARDLQAQRVLVELDGALEVVDAHPGMEEFLDGHGRQFGDRSAQRNFPAHSATGVIRPPRRLELAPSSSTHGLNRKEPNAGELKPKTTNPIGRKNAQNASGPPVKDSRAPIGATQGIFRAADSLCVFVAKDVPSLNK
jgi:hypothetical protein